MSRAFVKEPDGDQVRDDVPERAVSEHPNYVTVEGLALIEAELTRLEQALAEAQGAGDMAPGDQSAGDKRQRQLLQRDLRYWTARRASAELVEPAVGHNEVRFGDEVSIERDDGRRQVFQLVGEDEADPACGKLSYVAPLARAVAGQSVGDEVVIGSARIKILAFRTSGRLAQARSQGLA